MPVKKGTSLGKREGSKTKTVAVRMDTPLYDKLQERAGDTTLSEFIRQKLEGIVN